MSDRLLAALAVLLAVIALALLLGASSARAQVVDSLVKYCPPERLGPTSPGDTIVVMPKAYSLAIGQSVYLRAIQCGHMKVREVSRASGITWSSSDTAIVIVTRTTGRVTAKRPGTAVVRAEYP